MMLNYVILTQMDGDLEKKEYYRAKKNDEKKDDENIGVDIENEDSDLDIDEEDRDPKIELYDKNYLYIVEP